jgi:hypothetical protein
MTKIYIVRMTLSIRFILFRGGQFYWWRKPEYLQKTTDLSPVTDKWGSPNIYIDVYDLWQPSWMTDHCQVFYSANENTRIVNI